MRVRSGCKPRGAEAQGWYVGAIPGHSQGRDARITHEKKNVKNKTGIGSGGGDWSGGGAFGGVWASGLVLGLALSFALSFGGLVCLLGWVVLLGWVGFDLLGVFFASACRSL